MQQRQEPWEDFPDEVQEHLSNMMADYNHRIVPEHAEELLADDVRMKILELQESELVQEEMEATGVIPLTEQEMDTMELNEIWEQLRQIRNAQSWDGPTLLGPGLLSD